MISLLFCPPSGLRLFVSPYYIASTLLYSTVLYYVPSLLCLPKWLTHNAVCVCGQLGRPLDGGRREGKRSGNGSWNHSISLPN